MTPASGVMNDHRMMQDLATHESLMVNSDHAPDQPMGFPTIVQTVTGYTVTTYEVAK